MRYPTRLLAAALLGTAFACSNSTDSSPPPGLAGTYSAASFRTIDGGVSIDRIAAGLIMVIRLRDNGTTTGTISERGTVKPITGTWDTTGTAVHFHDAGSAFLNDLPFQVHSGSLSADDSSGTTRYTIVLRKVRD